MEAEQKSQARALHEAGHPLSESPLEQAQQVLSAYGKDLDTFQPRERGVVVDASRLSHPKATIKASILRLLDASEDPSQSALLESAFVKLADFQHGVGESPAALSAPDNRALSAAVDAERRTLFAVLKQGGHLRKS